MDPLIVDVDGSGKGSKATRKRKETSISRASNSKRSRVDCPNICSTLHLCCSVKQSNTCSSKKSVDAVHLTPSEHCCQDCVSDLSQSKAYKNWRQKWIYNGAKFPPSVSNYLADCGLAYWLECVECGKWRCVPNDVKLSEDLIRTFTCSLSSKQSQKSLSGSYHCTRIINQFLRWRNTFPDTNYLRVLLAAPVELKTNLEKTLFSVKQKLEENKGSLSSKNPCKTAQDKEVVRALEYSWLEGVSVPCLLRDSPAAPFLGAYFPESVGISPISSNYRAINYHKSPSKNKRKRHNASKPLYTNGDVVISVPGLDSYFHPFYQPYEAGKALSVRPDIMEADEVLEFPEFADIKNGKQSLYLGLRNLIIALWNLNPKEFVTPETCSRKLIVRGLIRVRCVQELERIIDFLTRKGTVNAGALRRGPLDKPLLPPFSTRVDVIVIGAGIAGLAAASQLHNFGASVQVLEASENIGGRICDHVFENQSKPVSTVLEPRHNEQSISPNVGILEDSPEKCDSSSGVASSDSESEFSETNTPSAEENRFAGVANQNLDLDRRTSDKISDENPIDKQCQITYPCLDQSHKLVVGMGASFVHGPMNNPVSLMCHQLNLKLKRLRSHCHLYTESGEQISQSMDKKVENHFNQLLERVSRWNNSDSGTTEYDASSYLFARGHDALPIWYKNALKQSQLLNVETAATDVTGSKKLSPATSLSCTSPSSAASTSMEHISSSPPLSLPTSSPRSTTAPSAAEKWETTSITSSTTTTKSDVTASSRLRKLSEDEGLGDCGYLKQEASSIVTHGKDVPVSSRCISLGDKLQEIHEELIAQQISSPLSDLERRVLEFHAGNLEFGCGSSLQDVSAANWDQNDQFPQFAGGHCFMASGYYPIVEALSKDLHIVKNCKVTNVDYSSASKVSVKTESGEVLEADKVIIAVPLTVLKRNVIQFTPSLPSPKRKAIRRLGAGVVEKVALWFSTRFWERKIKPNQDYFGHVPQTRECRGLFNIFYIITSPSARRKASKYRTKTSRFNLFLDTVVDANSPLKEQISSQESSGSTDEILTSKATAEDTEVDQGGVLLTVVTGDAVQKLQNMQETEIVEEAYQTLSKLFPEQRVPYPEEHFVSRWGSKDHINMSYSFVKCGASGADYDILSQPIDDRVFFAGECTNRAYPQTVTGAYLSGIREAANVVA